MDNSDSKSTITVPEATNNNIKNETLSEHKMNQNIFEVATEIGRVHIEVLSLPSYKWIILTHSETLLIDGSVQLGMKTPFGDKPSVLDIGADENQAESEDFCSKLCSELGCPVVLSFNLQVALSIKDQRGLIKFLTEKYKKEEQEIESCKDQL